MISAGGSGTFNAVLEGCLDSKVGLREISLGFLRKGSADLIGKVLGMPDEIEAAIRVFVDSLAAARLQPCDVIRAESREGDTPARHFVGYGGAEIFGRIPHYTENRLTKYYKGVLSQLFGDLGPFFVGASLSSLERAARGLAGRKRRWVIEVDGGEGQAGRYQAMIVVNGDLGPDLPFARGVPLGSGDFHLFGLKDLGAPAASRAVQEGLRLIHPGGPGSMGLRGLPGAGVPLPLPGGRRRLPGERGRIDHDV